MSSVERRELSGALSSVLRDERFADVRQAVRDDLEAFAALLAPMRAEPQFEWELGELSASWLTEEGFVTLVFDGTGSVTLLASRMDDLVGTANVEARLGLGGFWPDRASYDQRLHESYEPLPTDLPDA